MSSTLAVKARAMPPATMTRMMKTRSRMKAAAREPRSASSTTSGTPSGVTIARWRLVSGSAEVSVAVVIVSCRERLAEIERPEDQHEPADRIAGPGRHHPLPGKAFEHSGDAEHQHAAEGDLPGGAPGLRQRAETALAAGKEQGAAEREAGAAGERDRQQLGAPMDDQPAADI